MSGTTGPRPTELTDIDTPVGVGRLHIVRVGNATPHETTVMLGHGAGGGVEAVDLTALAAGLPDLGISVIRFEQPWRVADKLVAVLPPKLDLAWVAAVAFVRRELAPSRLILGGRSAGARVACRTSGDLEADGVVCCAFPLHPPGRPDRSRLAELLMPTAPVLVLQGTKDGFGSAALVREQTAARHDITVVEVPGADHGMRVARAHPNTPAGVRRLILESVASYCRGLAGG